MSLQLRVKALDINQNTVGICDAYTDLTLVIAYNGVGSFTFTVPLASPQAALWSDTGSVAVHVVNADGSDMQPALFSGPVEEISTTESDSTNTVEVSGVSDDTYLYDRLINPTLISMAMSADIATGPAETVIKDFAGRYLRAGDVLIEPDEGRGGAVTFSAAFQSVGLVASQVAETGAVGWKIRSTVDPSTGLRARVLTVWVPSATSLATFSRPQGSISSDTYVLSAPTANRALVRGPSGVSVFDNTADQAYRGRIIETFVDDSSQSDSTQLAVDGRQALIDAQSLGSLDVTAIDLPGQAFLSSYGLGDTVTAVVNGVPVSDRVRQVQIQVQAGSALSVTPVIGSFGAESTGTEKWVPLVKKIAARLAALERNAG